MDYGPSLMNTYEVGGPGPNIAYKGIAVRLDAGAGGVSRGKSWALFDHDTLRFAAGWTGDGFIDWKGIHFNGQHQVHPKLVGERHVENPVGPGWADPETGSFKDPRLLGRDKRPYGPLPRTVGTVQGHLRLRRPDGDRVHRRRRGDPGSGRGRSRTARTGTVFTRTLEVGKSSRDLLARIAPDGAAVAVVGDSKVSLAKQDGFHVLTIPAAATPTRVKVLMAKGEPTDLAAFAKTTPAPRPLKPLTEGGPKRWPEVLKTTATLGKDDGPFAVDTFGIPERNPWNALLRLTGFDFFPDGKRMAVCTWDGDVWAVGGIDKPEGGLTWQRIASGLFQPLGLKVRDGAIFVCCRDQIVKLHDLNGDGETDFYECFNNDHQVTEHFHEFAMGLQTDAEGNFYYAKSGRHALPAFVPHHGTLLKVSKDGAKTEILATGFRAANGVCLNPDGTFFVTDQEGFWTPKNRINLVEKGGFYGNMWGYTDVTDTSDSAMKQPLCWITNEFDRSPAELIWVPAKTWGPLAGSLLNTSYGMGKIYVVPHETVNGQAQGGHVRPAAADVPHRRHAAAVPPDRRPPVRVRHVRLGRQPDRPRRVLPRAVHRQAGRPARRAEGEGRRGGNHLHRRPRPEGGGREELRREGVGAEAEQELRLEAHRREAADGGEGHAEHRRQDGPAGPPRPGPDVVHGDQVPAEGDRRPAGARRGPQHDPRTPEMTEERGHQS